jgi:lysophospholipase L1-like esterase
VPTTAGNAPLRWRLGCALTALATTAVVCVVAPRAPAASLGSPLAAPLAPASAPVSAGLPPTPITAATTPATTARLPPAAPLHAGGGCGFTRGAAAGDGVAPAGHCTVVEIGDSLGSDLGWGLAREVAPSAGITLVQLDKSSTGLAVPSYFDWPAQLAMALPRYRPQLVVICLGGNDQQGIVVDGKPVQFGTPAWRTGYLARVHQLAAEATRAGAFVLWVGLPVMQQPTYDRGTQELDADFQAGIAGLPRAAYVSTRATFAGPTGAYASQGYVDGVTVGLRESDGIHLSLVGENVAASYVLQQVSALFDVRLAAVAPAVIQRQG